MTYTHTEIRQAMKHINDHALEGYMDEFSDTYDMDEAWEQLMDEDMHTPVQLDPSTSPNGQTNKYMIQSNMIMALDRDTDGVAFIRSIFTPNHAQRKWMNNN